MRLPDTEHTSRPWRIHELTGGFRLEDVWALPTPGGPGDFPRLVELVASGEPARGSSRAADVLWAIRRRLGAVLGWDDPAPGPHRATLRDRLPPDLRAGPSGPGRLPFTPLYLTADEWAAEIINRTVHGVLHLGWVMDQPGRYHGQLAVYAKPNGPLGAAYMAGITPFRHLVVYPPMIQAIGQAWRARGASPSPSPA